MLGFIVNCGSSSIKTRLIDTDTKETLFEARAGHLKTSSSTVTTKVNYDLLSYLPDTLETVKGQDILVEKLLKT